MRLDEFHIDGQIVNEPRVLSEIMMARDERMIKHSVQCRNQPFGLGKRVNWIDQYDESD